MVASRVLHIVSAMNRGGAETLLMNVYRNIDKDKVQFDFISHRSEICDFDEEIESLGGKIYRIRSLGQQGPLAYVRELQKMMKTNQYVAVHSHTDYQSGFPAFAAKLAGIKLRICHSHSNHQNKGLKDKLVLKALQGVIHYAATDYCACSKEAARSLFGEKQVLKDKVYILKNGIEIHKFMNMDGDPGVGKELGIPNESKIIGHVGNFSTIKNQTFILKILKKLLDQDRNVIAIFVGEGPLRTSIEEEAKKLGVYDHLRFLGMRTDIARLMKAFDVFLFPSLYEGFGIVALEAQCAGTPCVVSDTVPKTTDMGLNLVSYLSLNEDLLVWVNKINEAFQLDRPNYHTISEQFLKQGFSIQENIPQWLSLYGIS